MSACGRYVKNTDPRRFGACVKCGHPAASHTERNPELEREFLQAAARQAGLVGTGFEEQVADRLVKGQTLYGTQALRTGMRKLVTELAEEGLDLGSWAALALQSEDYLALDDDSRIAAGMLLQRIAARGCGVLDDIRQLRDILAP